jgi:hypothetical protein
MRNHFIGAAAVQVFGGNHRRRGNGRPAAGLKRQRGRMARIERGMSQRRRGAGLAGLVLIVVALTAITWLTAPRHTASTDTGPNATAPGIAAPGPKPSASLTHPGSLTMTRAGTDSRDNGTAQAGRAAPASDSPPSAAPAGAPAPGG